MVLVAAAAPAARAQDKSAEVTRLSTLLGSAPAGMSEGEWKEKRRDAARKLGDMGDPRAVPALIQVVEKEEFDIVGEYAIEALGKLRDRRAVDVLSRVVNDPSRDREQQAAARKALKRIGAEASSSPAPTPTASPSPSSTSPTPTSVSSAALTSPPDLQAGADSNTRVEDPPTFDDDVLAAGEIIRLAVGGLSFQYDSVRKEPTLGGDVAGSYEKRVDKQRSAWRYGVDAASSFGVINYEGDDSSSRFGTLNLQVSGEGRVYLENAPLYGGALGGVGSSVTMARIYRPGGGGNDDYELLFNADAQLGVQVGYGRVLDVGEALRLRRIEQVLRETKTLGRPITPDLAEKVLAAWWSLRRELGAHERLVVTVTLLREAGVLLGEPNASTSYKLLQVLLDGQLTHRLRGFDVGFGIVESFTRRDDFNAVDDGRSELAVSRARYGWQGESGVREIVGEAFARYRVFAGDEPAPWAAGALARMSTYFYGPNFDPIGALELGAELAAANDDINDSNTGARVAGTVGWRWTFNRASNLRLAGRAAIEAGELFVGVTLDGAYGFLDVGYVGAASMPAAIE